MQQLFYRRPLPVPALLKKLIVFTIRFVRYAIERAQAVQFGGVVFNALRYGRSFDYFDGRKDRLMAVTTADVQRAANKYLDINNYIIGVSGDMAEDALDEFK